MRIWDLLPTSRHFPNQAFLERNYMSCLRRAANGNIACANQSPYFTKLIMSHKNYKLIFHEKKIKYTCCNELGCDYMFTYTD